MAQEQNNISHSKTIIYLSRQISEKRMVALGLKILVKKYVFFFDNMTYIISPSLLMKKYFSIRCQI